VIQEMPESEIEKLLEDYEAAQKSLKDDLYRILWSMRGGVQYQDIMHEIDVGDKEVFINIIKSNWEQTNKSGLALI
jgi:hypothetical protein|tara:strand:+ start:403 stop:630 length:228 start_codon:yes stop_codon:yes gene_type:complete